MKKIFIISPVRNISKITERQIRVYVSKLQEQGHLVYWPLDHTDQNDKVGLRICHDNRKAIWEADEIHIWYEETSNGSKFDMGGIFMLEILGIKKKVVIVNRKEAETFDKSKKSFLKVMKKLAD